MKEKKKEIIYNTRGCRIMTTVKMYVDSSVSYSFLQNGTTDLCTLNCGLLRVAVSYHAWWLITGLWLTRFPPSPCFRVIAFDGRERCALGQRLARRRSPSAATRTVLFTTQSRVTSAHPQGREESCHFVFTCFTSWFSNSSSWQNVNKTSTFLFSPVLLSFFTDEKNHSYSHWRFIYLLWHEKWCWISQ